MTIGYMLPIDRALLVSEWVGEGVPFCPSCHTERYEPAKHEQDCAHDLALCERGYPDQVARDRARAMLEAASSPTMTPPEPVPPTPRNTGTPENEPDAQDLLARKPCARPGCGKPRSWHLGLGGLGVCAPGDLDDVVARTGGFIK